MFYQITAGSGYGSRTAIYELVEGVLVLRDEGEHDNLVGNDIAAHFEGFTLSQAADKIEAENSEGSGHNYDGCHACTWGIELVECPNPPTHLVYQEPTEAEVIRQALAQFRAAA